MNRDETRYAVWAGKFYPQAAPQLKAEVAQHLREAVQVAEPVPKAIIAPHAGYMYSGPIAGSAFKPFERANPPIERIVLLGPSHRVAFKGLALSSARAYETPLGSVAIDAGLVAQLSGFEAVEIFDCAHAEEHSLEVELPFLQETLGAFKLLPVVTGDATAAEVAALIDRLWGGPETRFVISSDLSHYLDYESACRLDRATADAIEQLRPEAIRPHQACGSLPIRGLLQVARERGLRCRTLDLRNSGDTAKGRDRVVGYGAFACYE